MGDNGDTIWDRMALRVAKFLDNLWWNYAPTITIEVKWPVGWVTVQENTVFNDKIDVQSADPNDHYRPTLERMVGKQKMHWDWRVADNGHADKLTIKILKSKQVEATYLAMLWA